MSTLPNVRDLLEGHITLEKDSIDRLYLNGYVPQLQHGPGLVGFRCQHRGQPIASPALLGQEVIRDNLDLGRPHRIQLIFPRKIISTTPGSFRTRVLSEGVHPSLHISYKHFDLKQYFKEGRGLRTEGTFHDPGDFGVNKGIENMPYLKTLGRQTNPRDLGDDHVAVWVAKCIEVIRRS